MLELDETTEAEAPRLLRDKTIKHYRLFPFELRKLREKKKNDDGTEGEEEELYEFSICSDAGIERFDWWTGERFIEVLSLEPGALVSDYLDAGASVLLNHRIGQLVGRTKGWGIDGKEKGKRKVRARMKWSPLDAPQFWGSPQGVKAEVDAEVRGFTSIGYEILGWEQTKKGNPEKGELSEYTNTSWRIFEWSFVDIPADISVGDGRSRARFRGLAGYDDGRPVTEDKRTMETTTLPATSGAGVAAPPAVTVGEDAMKAERTRAGAINELGRVHGMREEADKALADGTSVDQFRAQILAKLAPSGNPQPPAEARLGTPRDLGKRYSYLRALNGFLAEREGRGKFDGPERELHDQLVKHLPANAPRRNGFFVPLIADEEGYYARQERTMDSKTGGKGAELVTEVGGELIELLQNRTVVIKRGAQVITGLNAPVAVPRQTGDMTFYWLPENGNVAVTASDLAFALSLFTPRTIMGKGIWSRQLMTLANRSVEQLFRKSIAGGHGRAIDKAAIHGKGADGQPQGVYNTPGVGTTAMGGVPTFGKWIDMQGGVADKNADEGALGYIVTPLQAAKQAQTLKAAAAGSEMNWVGNLRDGLLAGMPASSTGQMSKTMSGLAETGGSEHGAAYGNWNDVWLGSWAGLEISVDEITQADYALLVIRSFGMEDVLIRHAESFNVATGATI